MARTEIQEKLTNILTDPNWDEPLVVYFFVQMRKLLDHRRQSETGAFPNLRFYCDWVVHISKDRIDESTLAILRSLQTDIEEQIKDPNREAAKGPINFAYFDHLKPEMITLMEEEGLPTSFLEDPKKWAELIPQLVKVLENQPLVIKASHGLNISEIVFTPSNPGCVIMVAKFVSPVTGADGKKLYWFRLMNVY